MMPWARQTNWSALYRRRSAGGDSEVRAGFAYVSSFSRRLLRTVASG